MSNTEVQFQIICFKELESLKSELEESIDTTAAAQDMRNKREDELMKLKRSVEEETVAHEAAMAQLRQKHTQAAEELNVELETTKKVTFCSVLQRISILCL